MNDMMTETRLEGVEHWTRKGAAKLFLWRKIAPQWASTGAPRGVALFVHGSSMASQPTFDLHVPGRPWSSAMDWFAAKGFDAWCVDMEGYGRFTKHRGLRATIADGADDLEAAADYIAGVTGLQSMVAYGISSGALRAAAFAERRPDRVSRSTPMSGLAREVRRWRSAA